MDPEILSGTPVICGTRVPVYDVAASVAAGIPVERILSSYPSLKRKQVELRLSLCRGKSTRGRPRQKSPLPPNAKVISRRTGYPLQISMTKLLIDECLSAELALMARERGHHEASHVVWIGKSGWKDSESREVPARRGLRFLVTWNCKDFRGPKDAPGLKGVLADVPLHGGPGSVSQMLDSRLGDYASISLLRTISRNPRCPCGLRCDRPRQGFDHARNIVHRDLSAE